MTNRRRTNVYSPSTTTPTGYGTLRPPAQGNGHSLGKAESTSIPPRKRPRAPLWMELQLMAGAEPWVKVRARGVEKKLPGDTALLDLMMFLNGPLRVTVR